MAETGPGRPTKFKPEYVEQARKLCLLGATDRELADFFEVEVRTIHRWKAESDEFCHSIRVGKEVADERVKRSLYQRAIGYEQEDVKIFMPAGAAAPIYAPFTAKIAPDTTAAIFWLNNRDPENWRNRQQVEHSGSVDIGGKLDEARARVLAASRAAREDTPPD
jgi:hypothetical protein